MNHYPALLMTLFLLACTPGQKDPGGTAVGNPGEATMRLGENEDVTWNNAVATLGELTTIDCEGSEEVVTLNDEYSFLGDDTIALPAGEYCGFELTFDGVMQVEGETTPDTTFVMSMDIPGDAIAVYSAVGVNIDETLAVLELSSPNLLTVDELELVDGEETVIEAGDATALFYAETIASRSALWLDADADGELSDSERNSGPLSAGDEWEPEEQDEEPNERGCGGDGNEGWLFLALAPLLSVARLRQYTRTPLNPLKEARPIRRELKPRPMSS